MPWEKAAQLDHVRRPQPPWRDDEKTECGRDIDRETISRDQLLARLKDMGLQRASMTVCMTCLETARRHTTWDRSPAGVLARDVNFWRSEQGRQVDLELRALGMLFEAHREEFFETLAALANATPLTEARSRRRRQA